MEDGENVWGEEEQEEDEEDFEQDYKTTDVHRIVLIDARENMFEANSDGTKPFYGAMEIALAVMKQQIITSTRHTLGIVFFGTRIMNEAHGDVNEHVYTFLPRDVPSVWSIQQVQDMAKEVTDFRAKIGSMPSRATCPLKNGIWHCVQSLKNKPREGQKDIWLVTNDDNPFKDNADAANQTLQVARDAADSDTAISVWYCERGASLFDTSKFYRQLVGFQEDEDEEQSKLISFTDLKDITHLALKKQFYKRRLSTVKFILAEEFYLNVRIYKLIAKYKKPSVVFIDRTGSDAPLHVVSKMLCQTTGAYLDVNDVRTYFAFAGQKVFCDRDEAKQLRRGGDAELRLLYFVTRDSLPLELSIDSGYFIFPDENSMKGCATAFCSLLHSMLGRNVVGIARLVRTAASRTRLMAIFPQAESETSPAGMHLVQLPYSSEVRVVRQPECEATPEQVSATEQLIDALQLQDFKIDFPNPALQKYYSVMQAMALSEEKCEWDDSADGLMPDAEGHAAAATHAEMLRIAIGADEVDLNDLVASMQSKKRGAGAAGAAAKKPKISDDEKNRIRDVIASGKLPKMLVPQLKEYCKTLGVPVSGKKQELVDRITQACA